MKYKWEPAFNGVFYFKLILFLQNNSAFFYISPEVFVVVSPEAHRAKCCTNLSAE